MIEELIINVIAELDASLAELEGLNSNGVTTPADNSDIYEASVVLNRTVKDLSAVLKWRKGNGTTSDQ